MDARESIALLNDLERSYPVDGWWVEGLRVWPLVRTEIWWAANTDFEAVRVEAGAEAPRARRIRQLTERPRLLARWAAARASHGSDWASPRGRFDVLVLGDTVSRIQVEGRWVDRHTDPLVDALEASGHRALQLDPYHRYPSPLQRPALRIQPALDALWLRSRVARGEPPAPLAGYEDMLAEVRARVGAASAPTAPATVAAQARFIALMARWFGALLDRTGARLGVLVDHGTVQMAFNLACALRGIDSVELQHGVQAGNARYIAWENVPTEGYELLPSRYWCWSRADAEDILDWSEGLPRHQPLLGGNLWLRTWLEARAPFVTRYDDLLAPQLSGTERAQRVLITLSRGFTSPEQLAPVRAAIAASGERLRWWVRPHPAMSPAEAAAALALLSPSGADVRESGPDVPLYGLLRHMGAHLTHVSSTVIEARAFGVRSVVTHPAAGELFRAELAEGTAEGAEGADEILAALERQASGSPQPPQEEQPLDPRQLLDELLPPR